MSMPWQASYAALTAYIADQPSISIKPSGTAIPGDVRPEFYRLFDAVRADFIRDRFSAPAEQAAALAASHEKIRRELIVRLSLEDI
jgi:hypothetical protein